MLLLLYFLLLLFPTCLSHPSRPNVILILTDDQDSLSLPISSTMKRTHALLETRGTLFSRAFANTPVCCPSRSTLFTGRYAHSRGMTLSNRGNCWGKEFRNGPETDSAAVKMRENGYKTLFAGKYLNSYGVGDASSSVVPPGWSEWFALVGNSKYWNYTVSEEGIAVEYGSIAGAGDYFTDRLASRVSRFITAMAVSLDPFFVWISPPAAHAPFSPAARHLGSWKHVPMKRTPAFNASGGDKHEPVGSAKPLSDDAAHETEEIFRARAESLQAVDDLVVTVIATLREKNLENNTFIIFTSDNAFHLGQFRLGFDKRQPYDTDILVPLIVFGPGVEHGGVRNSFVSHVDIAPTILDLVGIERQPAWDGKSFKSILFAHHEKRSKEELLEFEKSEDELVLVEYKGEGDPVTGGNLYCGAGKVAFDDINRARSAGQYRPALCDSWNNTYSCLRGSANSFMRHDFLYCRFECFARARRSTLKLRVPCAKSSPAGQGEFYNLEIDPYQLTNRVSHLTMFAKVLLNQKLHALKTCSGFAQCELARRGLRISDVEPEEDEGIFDGINDMSLAKY